MENISNCIQTLKKNFFKGHTGLTFFVLWTILNVDKIRNMVNRMLSFFADKKGN